MDGRCLNCQVKFGVFKNRETSCGQCKVAICKECCQYTIKNTQNKDIKGCKNCYKQQTEPKQVARPVSPPLNFKRQLEAKENQKMKPVTGGLEEEDLKIAERLDKLRAMPEGEAPTISELEQRLQKLSAEQHEVTQQEVEYRLAKLKGDREPAVRVHSIRKPNNTLKSSDSDTRVNRLIRQYTEEVEMETDLNEDETEKNFNPDDIPNEVTEDSLILLAREELKREQDTAEINQEQDKMIEDRVRVLSGMSPGIDLLPDEEMETISGCTEEDGQDNEDKEVQRIIDMVSAEYHLERRTGGHQVPRQNKLTTQKKVDSDDEEEEFPWCMMCNDDAKLRCHGCDGELFCQRCFRECHDKQDRKEHTTVEYKPKS